MNAVVSTLPTAATELTVTVNIPSVMESDAKAVQARVESAAVASDADYLTLTDFLGQLALRRTALEADRVRLKKPILQLGKDIEEMFRTPLLILHVAIDIGKAKLLAYDAVKRAEAEAKAALAANAAGEVPAGAEAVKREAEEAVSVTPRAAAKVATAAQFTAQAQVPVVVGYPQRRARPMSWGWRVTDMDKIDRKWLRLDEKAINQVVAEHKGDSLAVLGEGVGCNVRIHLRAHAKQVKS
jgi:hypothetical protein